MRQPRRMELQGYDLRYLITSLVGRGVTTTHRLRSSLESLGVDLGPDARRRLHGALRSEMRKGRLQRLDRGVYALGAIPRSTHHRIETRARQVEHALRSGSTTVGDLPLPTWLDLLPDDEAWDVVSRRRDAA